MARKIKYYLVAAEALPEIFIRVAEAKRMMQTGEADTVGAATKMAGISRSAFYKYKDAVQPFNDMKSEHIITFYTLLKDVSGTLSSVLGVFAASGANILTINQSIPTNGCAAVTISAETSAMEKSLEQLITTFPHWTTLSNSRSWPDKGGATMIKIAILGLGTVGTGVVKVVEANTAPIQHKLGQPLSVKTALVRKLRADPYQHLMTENFREIARDG